MSGVRSITRREPVNAALSPIQRDALRFMTEELRTYRDHLNAAQRILAALDEAAITYGLERFTPFPWGAQSVDAEAFLTVIDSADEYGRFLRLSAELIDSPPTLVPA